MTTWDKLKTSAIARVHTQQVWILEERENVLLKFEKCSKHRKMRGNEPNTAKCPCRYMCAVFKLLAHEESEIVLSRKAYCSSQVSRVCVAAL